MGEDVIERQVLVVRRFREECFLGGEFLIGEFADDFIDGAGIDGDTDDQIRMILNGTAHGGIMFLHTRCLDNCPLDAQFGNRALCARRRSSR